MELFEGTFSVAIVFAIGGSLLGSLIATDAKRYGYVLSGLMVLAGIILSVGVADYFFSPTHPWLYGGVGVFCGIVSPALLDALKGMAPKAIQRLINALCNRAEKMIGEKGIGTLKGKEDE